MKLFQLVFSRRSIRSKLLLYFMLLILFPLSTLGILGNMIYSKSIEGEANNHTVQMIDQVNRNVEFYINDMESIIYYLSKEPMVLQMLALKNSSSSDGPHSVSEVKRILQTFKDAHHEIAGILIASERDMYVSNEMQKVARDPLSGEIWYKRAIASPNEVQLISKPIGRNISTGSNYNADDIVSVVKAIKDPNTGAYAGVVLIDMKLDTIKKAIEDIKLGKNGFLYVTDSKGNIVYAPVNPIVYRVKEEWLNSPVNSIVKKIKGNDYQIIYKDSDYTKWKTIGVFSLKETLAEVTSIRNYSLVIGAVTLLLAIIAALFFTSSIARPLSKLRHLMKKAEAGDLHVRFESKYSDEIGQLGNSFNNMINEIRNLIEMVYVEQKSKREAELKTLQAQIKPHFLYNTLDTIQWMAQEHGVNDIVEIIEALTRLFRIGLSKGKEMITVREELEHIRSYLVIQKARYEDKLEYEINFDQEILSYSVLKLILQPLVENSIYHGIKERRGTGKIVITAEKTEDSLVFSVSDNGAGIEAARLGEINNMLENRRVEKESSLGYGIFNINERIKLSFGNDYGLKYSSIHGEGTTVEIRHPIH